MYYATSNSILKKSLLTFMLITLPMGAFAQSSAEYEQACSNEAFCVSIRDAIKKARKKIARQGGTPLSFGQILELASNRFGYGISSSERQFLPDLVTSEELSKISWILYSQIFNQDPILGAGNINKRRSDLPKYISAHFIERLRNNNFSCIDVNRFRYNNQYNFDAIPTKSIEEVIYNIAYDPCSNSSGALQESLTVRRRLIEYSRQRQVLLKAFSSQYDDGSAKDRDLQMNYDGILQEFWFNHFNIETSGSRDDLVGDKSYDRILELNKYKTYRDLLGSMIKSPGMIRYLSNDSNTYDRSMGAASNQNLGRELLELHTLGIGPKTPQNNSPYNQTDIEVSSLILTGHTALRTKENGQFFWGYTFNELRAYPAVPYGSSSFGSKSVSFEKSFWIDLPSGSRPLLFSKKRLKKLDSLNPRLRLEFMLDILANHKFTKRSLCRKFAERFMVPRLASGLRASCLDAISSSASVNGASQLQRMYLSALTHLNTWTPKNFNGLVSNPLESVVKSIRQVGISWDSIIEPESGMPGWHLNKIAEVMIDSIQSMGLDYRKVGPPTGYVESGHAWLSKGYLTSYAKQTFRYAYLDTGYNLNTAEANFKESSEVEANLFSAASSKKEAKKKLVNVIYGSVRNQATVCTLSSYQTSVLKNLISNPGSGDLDYILLDNGRRGESMVDTVHGFSKLTQTGFRK